MTKFISSYAKLCCVLAPLAVETINAEGKPETITFSHLLLSKCQQEFERYKQEDEERETMQKGVETAETVSHVTITWGIGVTLSLSGGEKETATDGTGSS